MLPATLTILGIAPVLAYLGYLAAAAAIAAVMSGCETGGPYEAKSADGDQDAEGVEGEDGDEETGESTGEEETGDDLTPAISYGTSFNAPFAPKQYLLSSKGKHWGLSGTRLFSCTSDGSCSQKTLAGAFSGKSIQELSDGHIFVSVQKENQVGYHVLNGGSMETVLAEDDRTFFDDSVKVLSVGAGALYKKTLYFTAELTGSRSAVVGINYKQWPNISPEDDFVGCDIASRASAMALAGSHLAVLTGTSIVSLDAQTESMLACEGTDHPTVALSGSPLDANLMPIDSSSIAVGYAQGIDQVELSPPSITNAIPLSNVTQAVHVAADAGAFVYVLHSGGSISRVDLSQGITVTCSNEDETLEGISADTVGQVFVRSGAEIISMTIDWNACK